MYLFAKSGNVHTEKMANANACEKSLKQRNPDILEASSNPFQTPETRQRKTGIMEKVPTTETIKTTKNSEKSQSLKQRNPDIPEASSNPFQTQPDRESLT